MVGQPNKDAHSWACDLHVPQGSVGEGRRNVGPGHQRGVRCADSGELSGANSGESSGGDSGKLSGELSGGDSGELSGTDAGKLSGGDSGELASQAQESDPECTGRIFSILVAHCFGFIFLQSIYEFRVF